MRKHTDSTVTKHISTTGNKYILANVKMLVKEDIDFKRNVKEVIAIHKNNQF